MRDKRRKSEGQKEKEWEKGLRRGMRDEGEAGNVLRSCSHCVSGSFGMFLILSILFLWKQRHS